MDDIKNFLEWAEQRGLVFGEYADNGTDVWFVQRDGGELDRILDDYTRHQQKENAA